jgi:hypothetical protein
MHVLIAGDLGGFLGLLLGGSVLSVFELLDFCIYNYALKRHFHRKNRHTKGCRSNGAIAEPSHNQSDAKHSDPENGVYTSKF